MMFKKFTDTVKVVILLVCIIIPFRLIITDPWWGFVIPVVIMGILVARLKWKTTVFITGFIAGFLIWAGADLFFNTTGNGIVLHKIAILFSLPETVILLISATIGGLVTGLSLYTGKSIVVYNVITPFEDSDH